jgi:ribosomal-protein-alanine N-acetyltransferase
MSNYSKILGSDKVSSLQVAFIAAFPEKSTLEFKSYLSPLYHIDIIEDKGDVEAFIIYQTIIDEVEITQIGTVPAVRGQGLATRLLQNLELSARNDGMVKIFLEVAASNNAAINLYMKAGYVEYSRRKDYYKVKTPLGINQIDAILMQKIL